MFAEKKVAFPQAQANSPAEAVAALESDYDTLVAVQYDEGAQQKIDNPGFFGMMGMGQVGQAFNTVATFLDPKEKAVGDALESHGYTIVRQKFRDNLPPGAVGKGSFGMVYKASRKSGKGEIMCGIKMIENGSKVSHLIDKEIDTLGMFRHPAMINFVETFVVRDKDWIFIVQEFAAGGDLNQALTNQPEAFDEALVRVLTYHICCAMGFAHQHGIMHRDLKPENILLTELGFPKVCDFGLSRRLNECDFAQSILGTRVYMAPEITRGRYDFAVDVYAVGRILQDMMAKVTVIEWCIDQFAPQHRPVPKKWPSGQSNVSFTPAITNLRERMTRDQPGSRPSFYKVIKELESLSRTNKKPHPFWGPPAVSTIIKPTGPPSRGPQLSSLFSPKQGDNIAGKWGFTLNAEVQINVKKKWRKGTVEHVSAAIMPGAVHVRYQEDDGQSKVRVVDPAHFGRRKILYREGYNAKCCTVQ